MNLLSLELTYFCSGLLFAAVVRRRVWDYAFTVTLLHVMITSLGEQQTNNASTHIHAKDQMLCETTCCVLCCSDAGVSHGVAVVAGFR